MKKFISLAVLCILFSCEKGEQGEPGNANVKSYFITVESADWTYVDGKAFRAVPMPEITSEIISSGTISVFLDSDNGQYSPLPFSQPVSSEKQIIHTYSYTEGYLMLVIGFSDESDIGTVGRFKFKVTVISGQ